MCLHLSYSYCCWHWHKSWLRAIERTTQLHTRRSHQPNFSLNDWSEARNEDNLTWQLRFRQSTNTFFQVWPTKGRAAAINVYVREVWTLMSHSGDSNWAKSFFRSSPKSSLPNKAKKLNRKEIGEATHFPSAPAVSSLTLHYRKVLSVSPQESSGG